MSDAPPLPAPNNLKCTHKTSDSSHFDSGPAINQAQSVALELISHK